MSMPKIKRFTRKKGLSFYVSIKKLNGKVIKRQSPIKMKVFYFLQANSEKYARIFIRITYKPGLVNEGEYTFDQKNEMINAWQSFTDEDLIKDAITNY